MLTRLLVLVMFMAAGCGSAVVRNEVTYRTEVNFMEQVALQQADQLTGFINISCPCRPSTGEFMTNQCRKAAKIVLTVRARVPWHKKMMLYNAGLLDKRPPRIPPAVPPLSTMCPQNLNSHILDVSDVSVEVCN